MKALLVIQAFLFITLTFISCNTEEPESGKINSEIVGWWQLDDEYTCFSSDGTFGSFDISFWESGSLVPNRITAYTGTWNPLPNGLTIQFKNSYAKYDINGIELDWMNSAEHDTLSLVEEYTYTLQSDTLDLIWRNSPSDYDGKRIARAPDLINQLCVP